MKGYINGFDWLNVEPMKYWSFGANVSDEAKKEIVHNAIFSGEYMGALKVDGYYQRVLKDEDGNIFMIARSRNVKGEIVDKHEWVPHLNPWFDSLPNGTCLLCECYWPGNEGSKNITSILGCLKDKAIARQKENPLHLYVFDIMAFDGVNHDNTPYEQRLKHLHECFERCEGNYVEFAKAFEGQELWSHLQKFLAAGKEGMVIMRKDAIVYNKRTPARVSIKVKKELRDTIDCFFTGKTTPPTKEYTGKELATWPYWEDLKTGEKLEGLHDNEYFNGKSIMPVTKSYWFGFAGSLEIGVYDGDTIVPIGYLSNLIEDIKARPELYAMQPIEVTAMEIDAESHSLRHGRLVGIRNDITAKDCTLEKFINNR